MSDLYQGNKGEMMDKIYRIHIEIWLNDTLFNNHRFEYRTNVKTSLAEMGQSLLTRCQDEARTAIQKRGVRLTDKDGPASKTDKVDVRLVSIIHKSNIYGDEEDD
jgi:hypothetical protein